MLEIGRLKAATPATVFWAGILFVKWYPNDLWLEPVSTPHTLCAAVYSDMSYLSFVQSWIVDKREVQSEKANLAILFDRYVPACLDCLKQRFKKITPISDNSMVQSLCYLLEVLLTPENTPPDSPKELYEMYFVFAAVWAFGGAMYQYKSTRLAHKHNSIHLCTCVLCVLHTQYR